MKSRWFTLFLCLALLLCAVPSTAWAADEPVHVLGSGTLGVDFYVPDSGTPVSGCGQVIAVGDQFFAAMTTAERKIVGYWFSRDGQQLRQMTLIDDLSQTTGDLSQPSVCQLNGVLYVGWVVVENEADNDAGGAQYVCAVKGTEAGKPVCVCGEGVWPRRPAMAAGEDGFLLVYRVREKEYFDEFDEDGWLSFNCYAAYVDEDLRVSKPYRVNRDPWAIYPAAAYSRECGSFLVVWEGFRAALVTKETSATPENLDLPRPENGAMEKPWVASDGKDFLVSAHNSYYDAFDPENGQPAGIWTVPVSGSGEVGTARRSLPLAEASGVTNGQLLWDGAAWLLGWSGERERGGVSVSEAAGAHPDYRYADCWFVRLDPETLEPEGAPVGVGTGVWNQFHLRFALGEGTLFCTYLDDRNGGPRLSWCALEGRASDVKQAQLRDGGVELRRCAAEDGAFAFNRLLGGFGSDGAAWTYDGWTLSRYSEGNWRAWEGVALSAGGKSPCAMAASGNVLYAVGWAGFCLRAALGDDQEPPGIEEICARDGAACLGVWAQDENHAWIVDAEGGIWYWPEGIKSLIKSYAVEEPGTGLHDIHGSSGKDIWAVGDRGLLLHYDGTAWKRLKTPVCTALNAVRADGSGGAWIVGDGGTVLRVKDGDCALVERPTGAALYGLWHEAEDCVFVCGADSFVYRWENGAWTSYALHRNELDWDWETGEPVDAPWSQTGALVGVYGVEEPEGLRLFAICEAEENGLYSALVPAPARPMLQASLADGAVRYSLRGDVPPDAAVYAARYDGGQMTGLARGEDGKADPPGQGDTLAVFLMDQNCQPLCPPVRLSAAER